MLSVQFIRENAERVKRDILLRNASAPVDRIIRGVVGRSWRARPARRYERIARSHPPVAWRASTAT